MASPTAPVGTPTPERAPDPAVRNATPTVSTPAPTTPVDPGLRNGSETVRTAVEKSDEQLEEVPEPTRTPASAPSVHLGLLPSPAPTTATGAGDATVTAAPEATRSAATVTTNATDEPPQATDSRPSSGGVGGSAGDGPGVPIRIVLVGLAGGAGAAASLGLTTPQSSVGHSLETVRSWTRGDGPRLLPLLLGRFGRGDHTDPLDHTHRQTLRDLVDDRPGVHLSGVVDEVSLSRSSVRHHVRVLENEGKLETAKVLGRRRLFPPDVDNELVAALADEGSRRVVRAVVHVEPAPVGEVVDEADRAYSTVSYHLDRLEAAGAVTRERDGRQVTVRLSDEAGDLLAVDSDVGAD